MPTALRSPLRSPFSSPLRLPTAPSLGETPALDLNFAAMAATGVMDSRVSANRTGLGTEINSAGQVAYGPHNLRVYSEQFDNATWSKSVATVSVNATTAPSGTLTADKVIEGVGSVTPLVYAADLLAATTYTVSVYAKAAERQWLAFRLDPATTKYSWFNLSSGTLGTIDATHSNAAIEAVGSGWYRCSLTIVGTAEYWYTCVAPSTGNGVATYNGDGASGIFVFGAQLNAGSLTAYVPTTSAAVYLPRFTYDPATLTALGYLGEEQRTNYVLQSSTFSAANWLLVGGATKVSHSILAPDGANTGSSISVVQSTNSYIYQESLGNSAGQVTGSVWLRGSGTVSIGFYVSSGLQLLAVSVNLTSQWTRYSFTASVNGSVTQFAVGSLTAFGSSGSASSFDIWGAQLEAGSATSYIPTTSASAVRTADVASMTGASLDVAMGAAKTAVTFVVEVDLPAPNTANGRFLYIGKTDYSTRIDLYYSAPQTLTLFAADGVVNLGVNLMNPVAAGPHKLAIAWNGSSLIIAVDGTIVVNSAFAFAGATMCDLIAISNAVSGTLASNSVYKRLKTYTRAFTAAQLQAATA